MLDVAVLDRTEVDMLVFCKVGKLQFMEIDKIILGGFSVIFEEKQQQIGKRKTNRLPVPLDNRTTWKQDSTTADN
jgi:hypothetical protein